MKKLITVALCVVVCLGWIGSSFASEATPKEVVQKVQEAVKLIAEKGEAAFAVINDRNGPFVWKDSYCFVFDLNGTMAAHPIKPKLIGRNLIGMKDIKGNMFVAEFVSIAKSPEGKGWSEYWWPKPGEKKPTQKVSYVMRVPGRNYLVAAGIYDMSKADAEKAAGK